MCEYTYTHVRTYVCVYVRAHISVQILQGVGMFALIRVDEWGVSLPCSSLPAPGPTSVFSGTPSSGLSSQPSPSPHRVALWKRSGREGRAQTLPAVLTECTVPSPLVSPVVSKPPREGNKGLEFTECLFLKSLYASPIFFFKRKKKHHFFGWWINNTKRTLVNGAKKSKNRGIVNFQVLGLFVEGERRRWSLPGGPIFFQLKGKIFLCRDSILVNTFYNVMIIKKQTFWSLQSWKEESDIL